uniref:Uncharacterized protein n=1 Tax=Meloidogyne incognita TaxID=6306 RepID=A0A914L8R6_MELIC
MTLRRSRSMMGRNGTRRPRQQTVKKSRCMMGRDGTRRPWQQTVKKFSCNLCMWTAVFLTNNS